MSDYPSYEEWESAHVGHRVQTWVRLKQRLFQRVTYCMQCQPNGLPSDAEVIGTRIVEEKPQEDSGPSWEMSLEEECGVHGHAYYADESSLPGSGRCYCGAVRYPTVKEQG